MHEDKSCTESKKNDGFGILHRNKFFNITPFTGWAFIYAAKKPVEIIGWYLIIFIFFTITLVQTYQLFQYQASQPTKTRVVHRSKTSDLYLPNITLKLTLPLGLMIDHLPLNLYLNPTRPLSKKSMTLPFGLRILNEYLCIKSFMDVRAYDMVTFKKAFDIDSKQILQEREQKTWMVTGTDYDLSDLDVSNPAFLEKWMDALNEAKRNLAVFWKDLFENEEPDAEQSITELNSLTYGFLRNYYNDSYYKLLLLEARRGDKTGLVKNVYNIQQAPTINDILIDALSNLKQIIHIDVEPEAEFLLAFDWMVDLYVDSFGYDNLIALISVHVVPKPQTKSLNLKIYSFMDLFLRTIAESLEQIIQEKTPESQLLICADSPRYWWGDLPTFEEQILNLLDEVNNFREWYGSVELLLGTNKNKALIPTGEEATIQILPLMHFNSQIDGCHNITMDACMASCLVREYISKCHCLAQSLVYLNLSLDICDEICAAAQAVEQSCFNECSQEQQHACNFFFTSETSQINTVRYIGEREYEESIIHIAIPETHDFARFIEEYEMTTESFFSRLGGVLELWSGINLMGVVHLFIFILVMVFDRLFSTKAGENQAWNIGDDAGDIETLEQKIQELMATLENPKVKSLSEWLVSNEFYELTPMSGYAYIVAAEKRWEKVFWYLVILCFLIGGSVNIHSAYTLYAAKPSQTILVPTANIEGFKIPNLTLELGLPPMELGVFKLSHSYNPQIEYSLDQHWKIYNPSDQQTAFFISDDFMDKLEESVRNPIDLYGSGSVHLPSHTFSSADIFEEWQQSLNSGIEALEEVKRNQTEMTLFEIQKVMPHLVTYPLQSLDQNLALKVFLLDALKSGVSPKELMYQRLIRRQATTLRESKKHLWMPFETVTQVLNQNGWTAKWLIDESISSLQKILHVAVDDKHATVFLSHCSLELSSYSDGFKVQFEISIPEGLDHLHIKVYSFMDSWMRSILDWSDSIDRPNRKESKNIKKEDKSPENLAMITLLTRQQLNNFYELFYIFSYMSISPIYSSEKSTIANSFTNLPLYLKPLTLMSTKTDDCVDESLEWCTKQCIVQSHYSHCQCFPWYLSFTTYKSELNVCESSCNLEVSQACLESCNPCTNQKHRVSSEYAEVKVYDQLFEINITIPQVFYPKLIREYEITGSMLLSNLGALLDFWCGINIIALLHLFLYLLKHIYFFIIKRNTNYRHEAYKIEKRLKVIQESRVRVQLQLSKLKLSTTDNATNEQKTNKSQLDWLWEHRFYDETGMTGFAFIPAAKHYAEAIFWWMLIILFFAITINNVRSAFVFYNSKPTHTMLSFNSTLENIELGNITLTIQVPLMELSPTNPIYGPGYMNVNHTKDTAFESATNYFMCVIHDHVKNLIPENNDVLESWLPLLKSNWTIETSDIEFPENGLAPLEKASQKLLQFFEKIHSIPVPKETEIDEVLQEELYHLLNEPRSRFVDAQKRFLLLEFLKTGKHPKEKVVQIIKEWDPNNNNSELLDDGFENSKREDLLKDINPHQLFDHVEQDIMQMIYINSSEQVKTSFIDWECGPRAQTVKFEVYIPPDVDKITYQIEFYGYEWWLKIFDTFRNFFAAKKLLIRNVCFDKIYNSENIQEIITHQTWLIGDSVNRLDRIACWLEMDQGSTVIVSNYEPNQYILKPTTNFHSLTDEYVSIVNQDFRLQDNSRVEISLTSLGWLAFGNACCSTVSYSRCVSTCIADHQAKHCGCITWNLLHLENEADICSQPCILEENDCETKCDKLTEHPCKQSLYELNEDYYDFVEYGEVPYHKYSLSIEKLLVTYAVFTETYYFTIGSFVTHLAGLFDLFMGINVLSLIHIAVFLIKQLSKLKKSKENIVVPEPANRMLRIQRMEEELMERFRELEMQLKEEKLKITLHSKGELDQAN